jgi:hypothetical protein
MCRDIVVYSVNSLLKLFVPLILMHSNYFFSMFSILAVVKYFSLFSQ